MNDFALSDLQRRLANLIRVGVVSELDEGAARCKVSFGNITTTWLPWLTTRAGEDRSWWAPEPGEQVVLLSPSGELAQAVVLPAIYQSAYAAPATSKNIHRTEYKDGTSVQYDREQGVLTVDCVGDVVLKGARTLTVDFGDAVLVKTPATVTVDAPQSTFKGAVTVEGPFTYQQGMAGQGGAEITGDVNVTSGDVTADGVSLKTHVHGGVATGGGTTGAPV